MIRADLPGIDPEKDVEVTVAGGTLHIEAERREEQRREEKGYVRREVRYGSAGPVAAAPGGRDRADITATYKDGVLEIRIPEPTRESAKKIAIGTS